MSQTDTAKALKQIAERYDLEAVYAFGSRSKDVMEFVGGGIPMSDLEGSDVDIGVMPKRGSYLSARKKTRLTSDLEDLFGVTRVDVVVLPEAGPFLALDVIRGELLFCTDYDRQAEYELYALRKAGDLAYFERQKRETILTPEK